MEKIEKHVKDFEELRKLLMDPELKPNTNFILEPGIQQCNQKINVTVPGVKFMLKDLSTDPKYIPPASDPKDLQNQQAQESQEPDEKEKTIEDFEEIKKYNKVIFICESGPLFYISMDIDNKNKQRKDVWSSYRSLPVEFEGIQFCHIAKRRDEEDYPEEEPHDDKDAEEEAENESGGSGYKHKKWLKDEIDELLTRNFINKTPEKNILILSQNMTVSVKNCKFNLATAQSEATCILTNGGVVDVKQSEFRGNKDQPCSGLIVFRSHMMVKDSGFQFFRNQAIFVWGEHDSRVMVYDSMIRNNEKIGITLVGEGFGPYIYRSTITNNTGYGIQCSIFSNPRIVLCTIDSNKQGIKAISADPWIFMNQIINNRQDGIKISSIDPNNRHETQYKYREHLEDQLPGFGAIKCNVIKENTIGISVLGKKLVTRIEDNMNISKNKQVGIKIGQEAQAKIKNNQIFRNESQGILITEYSHAFIEGNTVFRNTKANVALGGKDSRKSTVIHNMIFASEGEGIFLIDAEQLWVYDNTIFDNVDGVAMINSAAILTNNYLHRNKRAGLVTSGDSRCMVQYNFFVENKTVGMIVKDDCENLVKHNIFSDNHQHFLVENSALQTNIDNSNSFEPQSEDKIVDKRSFGCNLI